ncbi:hypothetical protein [Agrococcus beijingensis]|uniref:hypothetical protein n=1 Tax=Agrococcus beijingensis TaxID=3068634 RepID=UPI002741BCA5|nr:hypothetical protein [Agrococcus sp. REN33]
MPRSRPLTSTIALAAALLLSACTVRLPGGDPEPVAEVGESARPSVASPVPTPHIVRVADELTAEAFTAYEHFLLAERGIARSAVLNSRDLEQVATTTMAGEVAADVARWRRDGGVVDGLARTVTFDLLIDSKPDEPMAHVCADVSDVAVFDIETGAEVFSGEELGLSEVLVGFVRSSSGTLLVDVRVPVVEQERNCA